jgi:hypothetical protein
MKPWLRDAERDTLFRFGAILCAGGFLNSFVVISVSALLGGRVEPRSEHDGGYYLIDHSRLTKVSKATYIYSYLHGATFEPSLAFGVFGIGCMMASGRMQLSRQPSQEGPTAVSSQR